MPKTLATATVDRLLHTRRGGLRTAKSPTARGLTRSRSRALKSFSDFLLRLRDRKAKLSLSERTYRCEHCGLQIDRDLNAALNLVSCQPPS